MIWDYQVVELLRVVDGDTYDLRLTKTMDFGFNVLLTTTPAFRFRLYGVDVVESNQAGGTAASRFAEEWIRTSLVSGNLRGISYKSEGLVPDGSFGRWLIDLYRADSHEHLTQAMIEAGYKKPAKYLKRG